MLRSLPPRKVAKTLALITVNVPIVFFVFNRPELTRRVLARIGEVKPKQMFIICDGPREFSRDLDKVDAVKRIIAEGIKWPCDIQYQYSSINLGCRERIVTGLDWVFSAVESAIILEDDCLPDKSFFGFAEEMLERFRDDPRVFHIGGNNFVKKSFASKESYAFSRYGHIWGWATWRRAWRLYESNLESWKNPETRTVIMNKLCLSDERGYWGSIFERCADEPSMQTTWDYQWTYTCWKHQAFSIYPSTHLVENIGQGIEATHTIDFNALFARRSETISFPLLHPVEVSENTLLDREVFRAVFMSERRLYQKVLGWLGRWIQTI